MGRAGDIVTRDDLMANVWQTSFYTNSKTIDVHLGWLRRKLGEPPLIETVIGSGYRLRVP